MLRTLHIFSLIQIEKLLKTFSILPVSIRNVAAIFEPILEHLETFMYEEKIQFCFSFYSGILGVDKEKEGEKGMEHFSIFLFFFLLVRFDSILSRT